jgi:hypothetical protein
LESWIGQTLTEQSALLETMIKLTYSGNDSMTELPGPVITTLIKTHFGKQQYYKAIQKLEAMGYMEDIRLVCVVLSVACLNLKTLFSVSMDGAYDSCEHVFQSATQVQTVNTALQGAELQEELGPFNLAWSSVL